MASTATSRGRSPGAFGGAGSLREPLPADYDEWELFRRLYFLRSKLPPLEPPQS